MINLLYMILGGFIFNILKVYIPKYSSNTDLTNEHSTSKQEINRQTINSKDSVKTSASVRSSTSRKVLNDSLFPPVVKYSDNTLPTIYSRGLDDYKLRGLLKKDDYIYKLFGRQTYPGSYKWEYYLIGKDKNTSEFKIPIGNEVEIRHGDNVLLDFENDSNASSYKAIIYDNAEYRYVI